MTFMGINRERLSYGIYLYFISLYFDPYKRLCLLLRCNSPQTKLNKVTLPNIIAVRVTAHCNIAYSGIFSQNISPCLYITGSFYILFFTREYIHITIIFSKYKCARLFRQCMLTYYLSSICR